MRRELIRDAFHRIGGGGRGGRGQGDGAVTRAQLAAGYHAEKVHAVVGRQLSAEAARAKMLGFFDDQMAREGGQEGAATPASAWGLVAGPGVGGAGGAVGGGGTREGHWPSLVSYSQFEEYCAQQSAGVSDDSFFALLLLNEWRAPPFRG